MSGECVERPEDLATGIHLVALVRWWDDIDILEQDSEDLATRT